MNANEIVQKISTLLSEKKNTFFLYIIIIILVNLVGINLYFRIDLTANDSYSLSDSSKEVVRGLEDPLNVKVFFTKDLPAPYNGVYRYINDILEEYAQQGRGNFTYEFIDVEKHKDVPKNFGVPSIQVRELKDDQVKFRNAFMGLGITHGDLVERIPSITQTEGIEYDITNLIKKITSKVNSLLKLKQPITVTLYSSRSLPLMGIEQLDGKVKEIVEKLAKKNFNKLTFKFVDTGKVDDPAAFAKNFGLIPLMWPSLTLPDGKFIPAGKGVMGLVVTHENRFETLHLLGQDRNGQVGITIDNLEDRINTSLNNLLTINPSIGYITGHAENDLKDDKKGVKSFNDLISKSYSVKVINLEKENIPEDVKTIIVNGPKGKYSDLELFKIDQFLMKGRSALFLIDSFFDQSEFVPQQVSGGQPMFIPLNPGVDQLIDWYGIRINRDLVLDYKSFKTQTRDGESQIPFMPVIDDEGFDKKNEITKYLKKAMMLKSSSITIKDEVLKKNSLKSTVLVKSSPRSWLMQGKIEINPIAMRPPDDEMHLSSYNLAVYLSGKLTSYFENKEAPIRKDDKGSPIVATQEVIKKGLNPANIIVISTADITRQDFIYGDGKSPNALLLINMIDYLNGNTDIPVMRSKGINMNPLKETSNAAKITIKIANIAGLPILVIVAGFVIWRLRNIRRKKIMTAFSGEVHGE